MPKVCYKRILNEKKRKNIVEKAMLTVKTIQKGQLTEQTRRNIWASFGKLLCNYHVYNYHVNTLPNLFKRPPTLDIKKPLLQNSPNF